MTYAVFLHPKAAKELERLDKEVRRAVLAKLRELRDDPERTGAVLKYSHFRKIRIGDYRAIYEVYDKERKVVVLYIGHRKDVYDDFSKLI